MKKLIVLSGYARAGKSTALKYFKDECNFTVASTSEMNHRALENFIQRVIGIGLDSYNKSNSSLHITVDTTDGSRSVATNMRLLLIAYIESGIEEIYGRRALGAAAARSVLNGEGKAPDKVIYEAFNQDEFMGFLIEYEKHTSSFQTEVLHVRSLKEQDSVDERELIDWGFPTTIWNDYTLKYHEKLQDFYLGLLIDK